MTRDLPELPDTQRMIDEQRKIGDTRMAETTTTEAPDADEILRAVRLRLSLLAPLVEECARLEQADAALGQALDALDGKPRGRRKRNG